MQQTVKNKSVLSYNGGVLTYSVSHASGVTFSRKSFEPISGKFTEISTGQYSFPPSACAIDLVCADCVADRRTGIQVPCFLLKSQRKKKGKLLSQFTLLVLHISNDIECCLEFKVDTDNMQDTQIRDGPTVIWRCHETLQYISPLTPGIVTAPINFTSVHWVGSIEPGDLLILGTRKTDCGNAPSTSTVDRTLKSTSFMVYSTETKKSMCGACFLPHPYSNVIRCLHVCTIKELDGTYKTSVVAASGKQLIWFNNGVPKEVCQLPFENPCELQAAFTSRGDLLFVISFDSGDACAIWKDSFKIAATWLQVKHVLVDDFIGVGFDQILLIFKDDPNNLSDPQDFKITDSCDINYPVSETAIGKEDESAEDGLQENRLITVQALEARLQAGLLSLQELQHDLQVKDEVIRSSCEALIHMVQGKEVIVQPKDKEDLISLWDDVEPSYDSMNEDICHLQEVPECLVEKVWHRIIDDLLVVGVKLDESSYESLSDTGLSLIMDQETASLSQVTKCQSNVLKLAISPALVSAYQEEPMAKKQRLDCCIKGNLSEDCFSKPCSPTYQNDLERTVTAVTELSPLLALNNTSCVVLLHARRKNQPDCLLRSEKLIVPCGNISLSLEDVLKGTHTVSVFEHCQGSLEDTFAVLSAYQRCSFHLLSVDYTLDAVEVWLMEQMQGKPIQHIPEIICSDTAGSLPGTLFIWDPKNPCEGTLTVFYRSDSTLMQCLHSLNCALPPSCAINTTPLTGKDSLTANLARSLEEELLSLRSSISSAESRAEKELSQRCKMKKRNTSTTDSLPDTKERIQRYREELQSQRMQCDQVASLTIDSDLYRQNMLNTVQIQMNTDSLASRLAAL
ncbi:Fanconi anemia group B protein [Pelodytes ibericus]